MSCIYVGYKVDDQRSQRDHPDRSFVGWLRPRSIIFNEHFMASLLSSSNEPSFYSQSLLFIAFIWRELNGIGKEDTFPIHNCATTQSTRNKYVIEVFFFFPKQDNLTMAIPFTSIVLRGGRGSKVEDRYYIY